MTDPQTIRDAAFVGAMWNSHSDELRELVALNPAAALEGFVEAFARDEGQVWALIWVLDYYSLDELKQAGVPELVVKRKEANMLADEQRALIDHAGEAQRLAREREERRIERELRRETPPTLSEMLARDREKTDGWIAHNSQFYASQVADLSESEADDLRARLDDWWPDKLFVETITRKSENSWSQENEAAAWLWFGPALDKDVTPRQWAELASCGVLFHDQTEWLQRKSTAEAKRELALLCDASDSRVWHQALQATPAPLPDELVEAVVSNLKSAQEAAYGLSYIGQRLYEAAGAGPLRQLSEVSDEFANTLRPLLAAHGDEQAQVELVGELRRRLEAGDYPPHEGRLDALPEVTSEDALDDLFACIELVWGRTDDDDQRSWYPDVMSPVMNAIRTIGGRKAVAGYDELIDKDEKFKFLRAQRDAVAQSMLRGDGLEAAEDASRELGLPFFAGPR